MASAMTEQRDPGTDMSIREKLNHSPGLSTAAGGVVLVIALALIVRQLHEAGPHKPGLPSKSFYSDDDGKTWFLDEYMKVTPFDHRGKPAYKVVVYRCGDAKPAVAYLERFSDSQKAAMKEIPADNVYDYAGRFMSFQEAWISSSQAATAGFPSRAADTPTPRS